MDKAHIIDGKAIAKSLNKETKKDVSLFTQTYGRAPSLAVILVGENPASQIYVRNKAKMAKKLGIESHIYTLEETVSEKELTTLIETLNQNEKIDGILVQLPLAEHINSASVQATVDPEKDVDGFHPINVGRRVLDQDALTACTPVGCMILIESVLKDISGKHAVVVGRSHIVGRPMADLLIRKNATVTLCHSQTKELKKHCQKADILVVGVGVPKMVKGDWIKNGAIVIDVGINRLDDGTLCGDIDFDQALDKVKAITPVPKGVGPMTIACLMRNTVIAATKRQTNKKA